jgi:hypothetical protein
LSRTFSGNDPRTREGRASDITLQFTQDVALMRGSPNRCAVRASSGLPDARTV